MGWFTWSRCRRNREEDLNKELEAHWALAIQQRVEAGQTPEEAEFSVRRDFGNIMRVKEVTRTMWGGAWIDTVVNELKFAGRMLRKSPGFTCVTVLTLALGIGANTAIFSIINAVLLRPLPFTDPDRLVRIYSTKDGVLNGGRSPLDLRDFANQNHTFSQMVAFDAWRKNVSGLSGSTTPEQMRVGLVPADYFRVLGVRPLLGRLFSEGENEYGRHYVAAIGEAFWKNRFAGRKSVLGETLRINDEPYTIIAVMPDVIPEWMEHPRIEIWTPFAPYPGVWSEASRGARGYEGLGRLKAGVSLRQAQADLQAIAVRLGRLYPIDQGVGVAITPLSDTRVGSLRPVLLLLMGAVGLILLIACTNLANLLLAHNAARQRELAVRVVLGAGRTGLVRQLLAETLLLSGLGGIGGVILAWAGSIAIAKFHPQQFPQLTETSLNWPVLLFTAAVSLITGLLCGIAPALTTTQVNLIDVLKEGGRSGMAGKGRQNLRRVFVVTEIAFSLMLLVGSALLIQSVIRLEQQRTGFREDHLLKAHIYLPPAHYATPEAITQFCRHFSEMVRGIPGVQQATITTVYPPFNRWIQMFTIEGTPTSRLQDLPTTQFGVTDAQYLQTLGIPLVTGRDFSEWDTEVRPAVALVNQEFVRRYFRDRNPVGARIHLGPPEGVLPTSHAANAIASGVVTIIGVMGNTKDNGLASPPEPQLIALYQQQPLVNYGFKDVVVRTASDPSSIISAVRQQLHNLDPNLPLAEVQTMEQYLAQQTTDQRFVTLLLSLFSLLGLSLAIVGIYGVVSYLVSQRRQEFGVRLALGATPVHVLWLVLKQALMMGIAGTTLGLAGAWACRQLMSRLLFGISPVDFLTFGTTALMLLAVALLAGAVPGSQAMRISPADALRQE